VRRICCSNNLSIEILIRVVMKATLLKKDWHGFGIGLTLAMVF